MGRKPLPGIKGSLILNIVKYVEGKRRKTERKLKEGERRKKREKGEEERKRKKEKKTERT